jgi:ribonuclease P protein component
MLPKRQRMRKEQFSRVLLKGVAYHTPHFLLRTIPASTAGFAVSVSKKVAAQAVDRNRVRRRVYATLAGIIPELRQPVLALFSAKAGARDLSFEAQRQEILLILKKAQLL